MTLEEKKKKKMNLKKIAEKLQEKGINVQICKRPSFKWISTKNA
ncbi:hypothetical protein [Heyndrickxia shackletonii]|nr:hypothetical protein [Heyndrickxia shackletonii]